MPCLPKATSGKQGAFYMVTEKPKAAYKMIKKQAMSVLLTACSLYM